MSVVNVTTLNSDIANCSTLMVGIDSGGITINAYANNFELDRNYSYSDVVLYPNGYMQSTTYYSVAPASFIINTTSISASNLNGIATLSNTGLSFSANIIVNSVNYNTLSLVSNSYTYNVFTTTGWSTWTKPSGATGNDLVTIMLWGGGGGGSNNTSLGKPGGGGACVIVNLLASQCNATCNVYVASGGVGNQTGTSGQTSLFYTNSTFSVAAYGGGGGSNNTGLGGGGGGWLSAGSGNTGGSPLGGSTNAGDSTFGGGGTSGNSFYGGGGGTGGAATAGGSSVWGGGGGSVNAPIGTSVFGGNGGNTTTAATTPGGGGGGNTATASLTAGARGEVRVWISKVA